MQLLLQKQEKQAQQWMVYQLQYFTKTGTSTSFLTRYSTWPRTAFFNWVSKVIRDCMHLTSQCDRSRKFALFSQPIRCKTKTDQSVARVFPRFGWFDCFHLEYHWFSKIFSFFLIGRFGFTTLNRKALCHVDEGKSGLLHEQIWK